MSIAHYLFGFGGRVNRAKQWLLLLIGFIFGPILLALVFSLLGAQNIFNVITEKAPVTVLTQNPNLTMLCVTLGAAYLVMLYINLAVSTKRLHDRNKSAVWLLVFFLLPMILGAYRLHALMPLIVQWGPIWTNALRGIRPPQTTPFDNQPPLAMILGGVSSLISLWAFVELYCLPGTTGDNQYGPDPLARHTA